MRVLLPLLLTLLAACASMSGVRPSALDQAQYDFSGAIRWGDFEGALTLVDPEKRETLVPTPVEMERYKQVQISSYRTRGESRDLEGGQASRDIEIGVINRHTQAERLVRYRETWRWDEEAGRWWLTSGLPDLWNGQ